MSELKSYSVVATSETGNYINGEINLAFEAYDADEVDALLCDKNKEIEELKQKLEDVNELIKTARQMLEDAKATAYTESVDAGMRERKLKRVLWIARAERAKDRAITCNDFAYLGDTETEINMTLARTWMKCRLLKPSEWSKVWCKVERKCRAKAEEYK